MRHYDLPQLVASGRTTRAIDFFVQELFTNPGKWINIEDHAEYGAGRRATDLLMWKIRDRIMREHGFRVQRKNNDHYLRIPLDIAKRLIEFRKQQDEAQKQWYNILKI